MKLILPQTNVLVCDSDQRSLSFFSTADSSLVSAWVLVYSCVFLVFIDVPGILQYVGLETALSLSKLELLHG